MGIFGGKKGKTNNKKSKNAKLVPKTRKEVRKNKRKQKKNNRAEYYQKKNQPPGKYVMNPEQGQVVKKIKTANEPRGKQQCDADKRRHDMEKKKQQKLQKQMEKNRKIHLKEANAEEDKIIKQMEKNLKLNKKKSKSISKSFATDGLSYLLEMCDDENRKLAVETEKQLMGTEESGFEFEDDLNMVTETVSKPRKSSTSSEAQSDGESAPTTNLSDYENHSSEDEYDEASEEEVEIPRNSKRKANPKEEVCNIPHKKVATDNQFHNRNTELLAADSEVEDAELLSDVENSSSMADNNDDVAEDEPDIWEDIYGRMRDKKGNVVSSTVAKYVPPAVRQEQENSNSAKDATLLRLKKQLKGLLNRLAEHNMHSIATQLDELYMSNSRNDMNEMLFSLMKESIIAPVSTPDRLITEHMMLISILHANIGTEVGAQFLLSLVKEFDQLLRNSPEVENKELDNAILMICHLYNFKVYDSQLVFQILEKLAQNFEEKEVEIILLILKTVGFAIRKDNPAMLKDFIFKVQQKASHVQENSFLKRTGLSLLEFLLCDSSNSVHDINILDSLSLRVQFMLDILLAIKNNNMTKIPQYDPSHVVHLNKLMKTLVRQGSYVTQLNISLDDLLKADQRGKWWIVGSAWTGNTESTTIVQKSDSNATTFSRKLLELARKQRMNTDIRRNIFCILMTAEDYMDAFEKLHHLGLKNQQEREVIYVIMDCCLQEKKFNPYYGILAQKFCDYNRKYQMTIQYTLWDKLKTLDSYSNYQLTNLARFLTHMFIEKGLPLSVLKVVQFGELDKPTLKLIRQIMLGILLHENTDGCSQVFERISHSPQLHNFREGLRLFIRHFLLKNVKDGKISAPQMLKLKERAEMADKILTIHGHRTVF